MAREEACIDRLYETEVDTVRRFLLRRCGSPELADDLTSLTFQQAIEHWQAGHAEQVTTGWLLTVARRRLIDHWRRVERGGVSGVTTEPIGRDEPVLAPEVVDAMKRIRRSHSTSLYLKYVVDLPTAEVADEMKLSYRAAESVLRRARVALREQLDLDARVDGRLTA